MNDCRFFLRAENGMGSLDLKLLLAETETKLHKNCACNLPLNHFWSA